TTLGWRANTKDGNPNGVAATFAHGSIIIGHLDHMSSNGRWGTTPLGLTSHSYPRPKVGAVRQPWALFRNAVGVPNCPGSPNKCPNSEARRRPALRFPRLRGQCENQDAPDKSCGLLPVCRKVLSFAA